MFNIRKLGKHLPWCVMSLAPMGNEEESRVRGTWGVYPLPKLSSPRQRLSKQTC